MLKRFFEEWLQVGATAVLGAGPMSGKSVVSAGVLRALADTGIRVAPFKVAGVVENEMESGVDVLATHGVASRCDISEDMCPFIIRRESMHSGRLFYRGDEVGNVGLVTDDTVNWEIADAHVRSLVSEITKESLGRLRAAHDVVVIEGAGGVGEVPPPYDLSNTLPMSLVRARPILTARQTKGSALISLLGASILLSHQFEVRPVGYVVTDTVFENSLAYSVQTASDLTGLPFVGAIDHIPILREISPADINEDELVQLWSSFLTRDDVGFG